MILKSLWARRGRNAWLLAELILVIVLTWYIADPVFVLSYNRSLPLGYNTEGLLITPICNLPSNASDYNVEGADSLHLMENLERLLRKLRDYPGVKSAAPLITFAYPGSGGGSSNDFRFDTLSFPVSIYYFIPHSGCFETLGIEPLEGKTPGELDNMNFQKDEIIISGDLAHKMAVGGRLAGKRLYYCTNNEKDTTYLQIKAVTSKVRSNTFEQGKYSCFEPQLNINIGKVLRNGYLLIRLQPDVSEQRFLHGFRKWAHRNLRAGNLYVRDVNTYRKTLQEVEYRSGVTNKYRMNIVLAIFFLVNLALGVTGTFWLQTRSRREEVGIMLSYGASPGVICRQLLGEAALLASFAWLIGCLIYLQYGIAIGNWFSRDSYKDSLYWINNFWLHYAAVSFLVYIIVLFVVLLGVYIPARRISRIQPTEALRDE
ncbi:ABC transporter permease [uncultured Bacteroides sp.]|uniref:ABC transporter permease n=1 Tax=uncultured Bacteroides sp. TaxID=162156 RepID=UPI0025D99FD2|nr:FtsX-like permease family protein [uncultured Bacteroides sp.]